MLENPSLRLISIIENCDNQRLFQPNGVAVLSDGSIVVADGGNDRLCLFAVDGTGRKSVGGRGFDKYRFKEPIGVFVSPDDEIYVTDWHNHRIVIYDSTLSYLGEFGHYGKCRQKDSIWSRVKSIFGFMKVTAGTGSYRLYLFGQQEVNLIRRSYSFKLLISGLIYWYRLCGSFTSAINVVCSPQHAMDKPNGVAFYQNLIVASQKNARCLSVYERDTLHRLVDHHFGPSEGVSFGRLCNLMFNSQGFLYVCDERANVIWKLTSEFKLADRITGQDSGLGMFLPFSCCLLSENLLGVCGGLNFQIIDICSKEVVYCSQNIGELHGIAYDQRLRRLYLADRSNSIIRVYDVILNDSISLG